MLHLLKKTIVKPETQTLRFNHLDYNEAYSLLNDKITSREGVFGIEWVKTRNKSENYFFMSMYSKPHLQKESVFQAVLPRDVEYYTYSASHYKASCFPFNLEYQKNIWDELNNSVEVSSEILFMQVLFKKLNNDWRQSMRRNYRDYLNGIEFPTNFECWRDIQYKVLDFIKTKDEWVGENPEIYGADQKYGEVGFQTHIRFAVFGDKKSSHKISHKIQSTLKGLNYSNKWSVSATRYRSEALNQMHLRKFPVLKNHPILCLSEILPFFCSREHVETASVQLETKSVPVVEVTNDNTSDNIFYLLPHGEKLQREADTEINEKLNLSFKRLGLIKSQSVVIQKIQYGARTQKVTFNLPSGLKLSDLTSRKKDLQAELAVNDVGITQGDSAGTAAFTFPSEEQEIVYLRELIDNPEFIEYCKKHPLPLVLGITEIGEPIFSCLTKTKHILMGGATGSGKSMSLNVLILILLIMKNPSELQMWLIDPKFVEFPYYESYPHVQEVITDPSRALNVLNAIVNKMEDRYKLFKEKKCRNIQQYNDNSKEKLPYVVIVIDEFADLVMQEEEIKESIIRLGQKARAAGIYMILTTQRPEVKIVDGLIKGNLPSRICFAMKSIHDYKTILDTTSPYKLLGNGDGIYSLEGMLNMERFQSPVISLDPNEMDDIIEKYSQRWTGDFVKEKLKVDNTTSQKTIDVDFDKLKRIIAETGETRIQELQKKMKISINRVKEYVDKLTEEGWLKYSGVRSKGYELVLTEEQRKKFLESGGVI